MSVKLIKTESDYQDALSRIDEIFTSPPDTPEADELELWVHLVKEYEDMHCAIPMPDAVSAIKFRMEQQGLTPADLVPYIGSQNIVSEVLDGKRPLSLRMIRLLYTEFGISAEALLQSHMSLRMSPFIFRRRLMKFSSRGKQRKSIMAQTALRRKC